MIVQRDILLQIMQGKITVLFQPVKVGAIKPLQRCGTKPLTENGGPRVLAVVDVLYNKRKFIPDITDVELQQGGFNSKEAFVLWWLSNNHQITDEVDIITFELLSIRTKGRNLLKDYNLKPASDSTKKFLDEPNWELINRVKGM